MSQFKVVKGLDGVWGTQYSLGTDQAVEGDHSVTYCLNRDLYRTLEWDQYSLNHTVWLFGCSYAMGMGVALEHTTANHLEVGVGLPVVNFAQGGSSIRSQVDLLIMILNQGYKPQRIAVVWPDTQRWPWVGCEGRMQPQYSEQLYRAHTQCDQYMSRRALLDVGQWRWSVNQLTIPQAELSWSPTTRASVGRPEWVQTDTAWAYPQVDKARDQRHPGVASHKLAAEMIQQQWLATTS